MDEQSKIVHILIKLDAQRLYDRIVNLKKEYLHIFAIKRTSDHFIEVFINRYDSLGIDELKLCSEELIVGLDQFYTKVNEMRWYLKYTEDMPAKVEDIVDQYIKEIKRYYGIFVLYMNAELK